VNRFIILINTYTRKYYGIELNKQFVWDFVEHQMNGLAFLSFFYWRWFDDVAEILKGKMRMSKK